MQCSLSGQFGSCAHAMPSFQIERNKQLQLLRCKYTYWGYFNTSLYLQVHLGPACLVLMKIWMIIRISMTLCLTTRVSSRTLMKEVSFLLAQWVTKLLFLYIYSDWLIWKVLFIMIWNIESHWNLKIETTFFNLFALIDHLILVSVTLFWLVNGWSSLIGHWQYSVKLQDTNRMLQY